MPNSSKNTVHKKHIRKEHIIEAALSLFSEKGFENTRVDEIAETAGVNKALIYYHFESKEAILNYLLEELFAGVKMRTMEFISANIIRTIQEGNLDILPDRMRFSNKKALSGFIKNMRLHSEKMLDYFLDHRDTVRLMLAESLKRSDKPMGLFHFVELMEQKESNPLYQTIRDADSDFTYSSNDMIFKFFFATLPLLNVAAYFDDYIKVSSLSEAELRSSFLQAAVSVIPYPLNGRDLMISISGRVTEPDE